MSRYLKVLAILCGALLLIACTPTKLNAQLNRSTVHHGLASDSVEVEAAVAIRDTLERAYCVTRYVSWVASNGILVYEVYAMERAEESNRSVHGVSFDCLDERSPAVHTHPSGDCNPSPVDYVSLVLQEHPFAALICKGGAIRFYWQSEAQAQLGPYVMAQINAWKAQRSDSARTDSAGEAHPRRTLPRLVYYPALGSALAVSWRYMDPDPGGYPDVWYTMDKLAHFSVGYGLTSAAITAGVRPAEAAVSICAVAIVYEVLMGWVSRKDIGAGCSGAASAWVWDRVWR